MRSKWRLTHSRAHGLDDRITYRQADLNVARTGGRSLWGRNRGDDTCTTSKRLEHLLDQIVRSLEPGGMFVVNEYIGPPRFQWLSRTEALMNRILAGATRGASHLNPTNGLVKAHLERTPAEEIARVDPSESIRSDEIPALLESRLDVLYRADFGGTLLQFCWRTSLRTSRRTTPRTSRSSI